MDLGLAGARVVVTGGASNIGRGIVHEFAAEGARIVISDIDEPQAEKVRAEALETAAAFFRGVAAVRITGIIYPAAPRYPANAFHQVEARPLPKR